MMDLDRKTYDSPEEIVVQAHRWITKKPTNARLY